MFREEQLVFDIPMLAREMKYIPPDLDKKYEKLAVMHDLQGAALLTLRGEYAQLKGVTEMLTAGLTEREKLGQEEQELGVGLLDGALTIKIGKEALMELALKRTDVARHKELVDAFTLDAFVRRVGLELIKVNLMRRSLIGDAIEQALRNVIAESQQGQQQHHAVPESIS